MSNSAWLSIIGLGEDGLDGLAPASQNALANAKNIWGTERLIRLLPETSSKQLHIWPVPFKDGIEKVLKLRGEPTVVLVLSLIHI